MTFWGTDINIDFQDFIREKEEAFGEGVQAGAAIAFGVVGWGEALRCTYLCNCRHFDPDQKVALICPVHDVERDERLQREGPAVAKRCACPGASLMHIYRCPERGAGSLVQSPAPGGDDGQ